MTKKFEKVPLKTILLNFVNHVQTLDCKLLEGDDLYEKEFVELKLISESQKSQPAFSCSEGEKDVNRRKNRYKDILPFDYTRVSLSPLPGIPGSDYINANFVKGASGSPAYIASQGPLPHTVTDFWRMVVECEVQVVIMACNETESGKHKCECYWPEEIGMERSFGPYTIRMLDSRQIGTDFCLRKLELVYPDTKGGRVTRTIAQFHYWAWPDHGVPTQVRPLLEMVRWVRDCQASETLPLLVHCSAGCGRTGTICALDYVWGLLRAGKLSPDFSLFELVREMRRQRIAMVQTKEQYTLVHRAVRDLFLDQLKVIDSHPYENLDINGRPRAGEKEEADYENVYVNVDRSPLGSAPESPQVNNPPPLPDRKRESVSPVGKFVEVIRDSPRHSRNNSFDTHAKSVTSTPVSQTPGSSYEELSAIVSKTAKLPVERSQATGIPNRLFVGNGETDRNFLRLNFTSSSPEPKHSRTKPSDVKAKSKGGKVSSVVKRSKSLKVPSTVSDVKVRPTSPILERRYLVPNVTEVVPERSFVRANRVDVGDSRFYVDLTQDSKNFERSQRNADALESRDCEVETISVRPPQMLRFPKLQSAPNLEPAKYQKFASVSPTLLRKPLEERVSISKKQTSLSPVFIRKQLEIPSSSDLVTASLDRCRDVRKSLSNLNAGSSQFSGLVGSIDRSGDPVKAKITNSGKLHTEISQPTICHLNASTTHSFPIPRSDVSRDTSYDSAKIPVTVLNISDSGSKKCDFFDSAQAEAPVPVVLQLKCESSSNTGDYDNVEKCARRELSLGKESNQKVLPRYEKVWLTSNSEPVYANLPLKKSISMKEIKLKPELCLSDKEYFIQKSDEIAKLLNDLKCVTEPVDSTAKTQTLKTPDGPIRSKSEDYISSPPFREPPSYEAVISSQLYKEKLSRIADMAESKERQQRRMARRENGPVAPPRTKRNGSFNDHTPKWSDSSKESSPHNAGRRGEESRLATPNSFPPPIPNRSGSFVAASSPKSEKGSCSASSPAGSPKSKPPMSFLKPDPPLRANAAAQAANRAFQKALSRFQATATQLKSKLINMKDPLSPVNGEDNIACSDQGHIYEDVVPPPDSVPVLKYTKKQEYL